MKQTKLYCFGPFYVIPDLIGNPDTYFLDPRLREDDGLFKVVSDIEKTNKQYQNHTKPPPIHQP